MVKKSGKKVWFIRHAESKTNASENYRTDASSISLVPLSELGIKQSVDVLKYFDRAPDLIITSSYIRTKQTAEHLIKKYAHVNLEEWEIHEFTYISPDRCYNTTFHERKPLVKEYWEKGDPLYCDGDGAESFAGFLDRINTVISRLKHRKEQFIVLFSHKYVMSAVKYLLEKNPKKITSKEMRDFRKYYLLNEVPNIGKLEIIFPK